MLDDQSNTIISLRKDLKELVFFLFTFFNIKFIFFRIQK
jgi:hypothetical protein